MKVRVVLASLLFTAAYAAPLSSPQLRVTPSEVDSMPAHDSGAGTSGVAGIRTTVVAGDPTKAGPYTIRLSIPANTKIQAHTHRDNRTAVVISGVWYFGYGPVAGEAKEKALPHLRSDLRCAHCCYGISPLPPPAIRRRGLGSCLMATLLAIVALLCFFQGAGAPCGRVLCPTSIDRYRWPSVTQALGRCSISAGLAGALGVGAMAYRVNPRITALDAAAGVFRHYRLRGYSTCIRRSASLPPRAVSSSRWCALYSRSSSHIIAAIRQQRSGERGCVGG